MVARWFRCVCFGGCGWSKWLGGVVGSGVGQRNKLWGGMVVKSQRKNDRRGDKKLDETTNYWNFNQFQ